MKFSEQQDLINEYEKALFTIATKSLMPYQSSELAVKALQNKNKYISTQVTFKKDSNK